MPKTIRMVDDVSRFFLEACNGVDTECLEVAVRDGTVTIRVLFFGLITSDTPIVVLRYIEFLMDLDGFFTNPIPFFPYMGLIDLLVARFNLPVVRAESDFLMLGFLILVFNFLSPKY